MPTADLRADLAALRAKVERMTPGPWRTVERRAILDDTTSETAAMTYTDIIGMRTDADAAGLVAIRNEAPRYLSALERIAALVADWRGRHERGEAMQSAGALTEIEAVLAGAAEGGG